MPSRGLWDSKWGWNRWKKNPRSRLFNGDNLDRSYTLTRDGGWSVQKCFFEGLVECWTPDRQFGKLVDMKGKGFERKREPEGKVNQRNVRYGLGVLYMMPSLIALGSFTSITDVQTATAVIQKFAANAATALSLHGSS